MSRGTEHRYQSTSGTLSRRLRLVDADFPPPERRKIAVLYVEDDTDDIYLLGHQLRMMPSFDVDFVHASTPADARFEVTQRSYDVVLCDFWLGSETTIPLIDELKSNCAQTPIVLVSSLENDDIELIGRRAGADGFVAKGDLTSASLDRVFNTLLPVSPAPVSRPEGAAAWLRGLMESLDRARALLPPPNGDDDDSLRLREFMDEILGRSDATRQDVMEKLAGLERATRDGAGVTRIDAAAYVTDAVRKQSLRARGGATFQFRAPLIPIMLEASPTLFGDTIDGFFAEAGDLLEDGISVSAGLRIEAGHLLVSLSAGVWEAPEIRGDLSIVEAAAIERRFLIETLARACGGTVAFGEDALATDEGEVARLEIPLRLDAAQSN
ncbi:response regulator [Oryzibacter oryziterrae]|uniref:response regulator n=1 Tax=Oryzibacter oryziterrae TaxID=2766474 RepID=UPI001F1C633D|nr:response regulator [Oryzibacter oryziterrae]